MAPQAGFEPATLRLTAGCSAVELLRNIEDLLRAISGHGAGAPPEPSWYFTPERASIHLTENYPFFCAVTASCTAVPISPSATQATRSQRCPAPGDKGYRIHTSGFVARRGPERPITRRHLVPDEVRDQHAEPGADEGNPHEVREHEHDRPDHAAGQRRHDHA